MIEFPSPLSLPPRGPVPRSHPTPRQRTGKGDRLSKLKLCPAIGSTRKRNSKGGRWRLWTTAAACRQLQGGTTPSKPNSNTTPRKTKRNNRQNQRQHSNQGSGTRQRPRRRLNFRNKIRKEAVSNTGGAGHAQSSPIPAMQSNRHKTQARTKDARAVDHQRIKAPGIPPAGDAPV